MNYTKANKPQILNWLQSNLTEHRFLHSIGCAETAVELADKFGLDTKKAYIAGILHDCAKCFNNDELLKIIKTNETEVDDCEMLNPKILHAPVSASIAMKEFGVVDEEILSAIRWHTLGKVNMSTFDKIVFLADKIEPNSRDAEYRASIFKTLEEDDGLDKAILICYKETIKSLVKRDLKICQPTIDIYNQLLK